MATKQLNYCIKDANRIFWNITVSQNDITHYPNSYPTSINVERDDGMNFDINTKWCNRVGDNDSVDFNQITYDIADYLTQQALLIARSQSNIHRA